MVYSTQKKNLTIDSTKYTALIILTLNLGRKIDLSYTNQSLFQNWILFYDYIETTLAQRQ